MAYRCPVKERFWRDMVARFEADDCAAREFCRRHRLAESAFHFWRRELVRRDAQDAANFQNPHRPASADKAVDAQDPRTLPNFNSSANDRAATPLFQSVVIRPAKRRDDDASCTPIDLRLRGGHVLRIRAGFDAGTLRQLLQLLDSSTAHGKPGERNGAGE